MNDYQYSPLDVDASETRFFILLPGEFEAPIQGLLSNVSFNEDSCPMYESLSYAWGTPEDPVEIAIRTCDVTETKRFLIDEAIESNLEAHQLFSKKEITEVPQSEHASSAYGKLLVTQNLGRALPYLRLQDKPRVFWIDAICVNQIDLNERSQQVQRMADIYRLATRTVFWLGEESNNINLAIDCLKNLRTKINYDFQTNILSPSSELESEAHWANSSLRIEFDQEMQFSFIELYGRPWFHRLWVRQEIYFASRVSILLCGRAEMLWQDFRRAFIALLVKGHILVDEDTEEDRQMTEYYYELESQLSPMCEDPPTSFLEILRDTKFCLCSDPRDRVYAVLSLIGKGQVSIEPDYTKTMEQLFQDVTSDVFNNSQSINFLRCCELNPERSKLLPSWVPDFRFPKRASHPQKGNMAFSSIPQLFFDKDDFRTQGVSIATVEKLWSSDCNMSCSFLEVFEALHKIFSEQDESGKYPGGETLAQAFGRTMVLDDFSDRHIPIHPAMPHTSSIPEFIEYISASDEYTHPLPAVESCLRKARETLNATHFFRTDEGYFGLCSPFTEVGDIVVMFVGCQVPLILRPQDDGTYLLVCEAFCQGMMYGEAFLGPLPSHIEAVRDGYGVFRNGETGEILTDDPRLGAIPEGWEALENEGDDVQYHRNFKHEETGFIFHSASFDPRTTPEELEKRGVKLREFHIV